MPAALAAIWAALSLSAGLPFAATHLDAVAVELLWRQALIVAHGAPTSCPRTFSQAPLRRRAISPQGAVADDQADDEGAWNLASAVANQILAHLVRAARRGLQTSLEIWR